MTENRDSSNTPEGQGDSDDVPPPRFVEKFHDWKYYAPSILTTAVTVVVIRTLVRRSLEQAGIDGLALSTATGVLAGSINFSLREYQKQRHEMEVSLTDNPIRNEIRRVQAADKRRLLAAGFKGAIIMGTAATGLYFAL